MQILIADDSHLIRKIISTNLLALGVQPKDILQAKDGEEALTKALAKSDIRLIISDIQMPKINGVEFIKSLAQSTNATPKVAIIISSHINEADKEELRALGVDLFLSKPFNKQNFMHTVVPAIESIKKGTAKTVGGKGKKITTKELFELIGGGVDEIRYDNDSIVLDFGSTELEVDAESFLQVAKIIKKEPQEQDAKPAKEDKKEKKLKIA